MNQPRCTLFCSASVIEVSYLNLLAHVEEHSSATSDRGVTDAGHPASTLPCIAKPVDQSNHPPNTTGRSIDAMALVMPDPASWIRSFAACVITHPFVSRFVVEGLIQVEME